MNSDMIKPKKFNHPHLVYHFAIPLIENFIFCAVWVSGSAGVGSQD